jgi:hypothetical protein
MVLIVLGWGGVVVLLTGFLLRRSNELVIAANIGPLPSAMVAMTAATMILSTVAYVTGTVTEASKAEMIGLLLGEDPRGKRSGLPTCHTSTSKVTPFLPYPKTIVKLQEKYWKLARNGLKSVVGFWKLFYEDRNYPNREELAAGVGN